VNLVDIHRSKAAAFGTVVVPDFLDFSVQHVGGHVSGDAENISVLVAPVVAEALATRTHPTDEDG
jgi:hypothetical protein